MSALPPIATAEADISWWFSEANFAALQRALLIYLNTHSDWSGLLGISNAGASCLTATQTRKLAVKSSAFSMRHRIPATGTLQRNYFFEVRDSDFQRGINKAVANNWITIDLRNRYRYQLTSTGYAVGRIIVPVLEA
jgi:hypothetical protein